MTARHRRQLTVRDCVSEAVARSVGEIIGREAAVRRGGDAEDVHQLRVAVRRLRSDLRTFASVLDETWADALRSALGRLGNDVGVVRDADVLSARLTARLALLPPGDVAAAQPLVDRLEHERSTAASHLRDVLAGHRYLVLRTALDGAVKHAVFARPAPGADGPDERAAPKVARLVRRQWRHLRRAHRDLPTDPTDEQLHRIRILAKRARYAAESATPAWGRPADEFATAMADVQQMLGELQDSVTAERWLRRAAADVAPAASVAGMLIAMEWPVQAQARADFAEVWSEASHRSLRRWLS